MYFGLAGFLSDKGVGPWSRGWSKHDNFIVTVRLTGYNIVIVFT
jgi:hypothetical protein